MSRLAVCGVERAVAVAFPTEWAEEWDRVGLLAGDPDREVTGVTVALDPTVSAVQAAVSAGDNVLLTHHPAFLKTPNWLSPGRGPAGVVFAALSSGVALVNAHTNLDRAPRAGMLLPEALGLTPVKPVERSLQPMTHITVFAPESHAQRIADAMSGAGAGRVGEYAGASYTSAPGTGRFVAPLGGNPWVGSAGEATSAAEVRIEVVAPRAKARGVVGAARGAHPYEEPLIVAAEVQIARSSARMGMLSDAPAGSTLRSVVAAASSHFEITPRVWGNPDARVSRVATATGSAGSLVGDVLASGASVLVAGEVRYHDALEALEAGLAVVELGHDVSEWPLVSLLADAVLAAPGCDPASVHVLPANPGWWTP